MSLVYMLVFLFKYDKAEFYCPKECKTKKECFYYIKHIKQTISCKQLTEGIDNSGNFLSFAEEIFNLSYEECPNYSRL